VIALGQNEAGVSEFWVPRGYAHVIVDVRGCNDSEGVYDLFGAQEQQDLYQGENTWRSEHEWPLKRTQWREAYLGGPPNGREGTLTEVAGGEQVRRLEFDPASHEAYHGEPRLTYRTERMVKKMELTGPLALYLQAGSSARDIDWLVSVADEAPDGQVRELCKGWLRSSHRKIDPARSTPVKPYHPHLAAEPMEPGAVYEFPIEIWPICNVFKPGHRIRLEIGNADSIIASHGRRHVTIQAKATNAIHEGGRKPSQLVVPVVPRSQPHHPAPMGRPSSRAPPHPYGAPLLN